MKPQNAKIPIRLLSALGLRHTALERRYYYRTLVAGVAPESEDFARIIQGHVSSIAG